MNFNFLEGSYSKWMLGVLAFLVIVWLLMRQKVTAQPMQVVSAGPSIDPNAQALAAQLQGMQISTNAQTAAFQSAAAAQVEIARVAKDARANDAAAAVQIARTALGVAESGDAARIAESNNQALVGKYNADASVAIANGYNATDLSKTISTNQTQLAAYGIQADVANNAIRTAGTVDLASIEAERSVAVETLQQQRAAAEAYYAAATPIGLAQVQADRDKFNTLSTILARDKNFLNHGTASVQSAQLAAFLGLVNPESAYSGNIAAASVGISQNQARASIFKSVMDGLTKLVPVFA